MPDCIVELKPRPRDKVLVKLSGGRFFTIPEAQAQILSVGVELTDEDIERLDQMDQYFRGKDKALRMLALRARTREEMRKTLTGLSVGDAVRDAIVAELEELGLVDDLRFTRDYVRAKTDTKGVGPHRLRHDLRKLGVRRSIVDDVLSSQLDSESQEKLAWDLVSRKIGTAPIDEKTVRRIAGLLQRKGYDYEIVNRISYELLRRSGNEQTLD